MNRRKISFVQSSKAHLPEIEGYRGALSPLFDIEVITQEALRERNDFDVLWMFMGFQMRRRRAKFLVHDYRSLSTGAFPLQKDGFKRFFNCKPDLRVFLTPGIREKFGFRDTIPDVCVDMGIPAFMLQRTPPGQTPSYDFCYVGSVSVLREIPEMLEAFQAAGREGERLLLIGDYEPQIRERYASDRILFSGKVDQQQVKALIEDSRCCICKIPSGYPYDFQTPTKLLEYGALGKKIIANASLCNRNAAEKYGIRVFWTDDAIFDRPFDIDEIPNNEAFEAEHLSWRSVITRSGLFDKLQPLIDHD